MTFFAEYGTVCGLALLILVVIALIGVLCFREKRAARRVEALREEMCSRLDAVNRDFLHQREQYAQELKEAYAATNRVVAELVRTQQTRLDAFSSQIAEQSAQTNGEDEQRLENLIAEVRRAEEAMAEWANGRELATRSELEAHFAALTDQMESWSAQANAGDGQRLNALIAEVRRAEEAMEEWTNGRELATRSELEAHFAALADQMENWSVQANAGDGQRLNDLIEEVRRAEETMAEWANSRELATRGELETHFAALSQEMHRICEEIRTLPPAETTGTGDEEDIRRILGQAQGEFESFAEAMAKTQKRLRQANESVEEAMRRGRHFQKKLRRAEQEES